MRQSAKRIIKAAMLRTGLFRNAGDRELPPQLRDPIVRERTQGQYDEIWSQDGFVEKYLSSSRIDFYKRLLDHVSARIDLSTLASVVDIGCGPGFFLKLIAGVNPNAKLVGTDLSSGVLDAARRLCPGADFRSHDIYRSLHEVFDLAVCSEVLEHLDYPRKALEQLMRCSSTLVITIPNAPKDDYIGHIHFWSMRSWELFLEAYQSKWSIEISYLCNEDKLATVLRKRQGGEKDSP